MALGPLHGRTVYALSSSVDGVARYIGSTSKPPARRLQGHLRSAKGGRWDRLGGSPVQVWIRSVLAGGFEVRLTVLMEGACYWCETAEIVRRLDQGEPLLNVHVRGVPRHYDAYLSLRVPLSRFTYHVQNCLAAHRRRRRAASRIAARLAAPPEQLRRAS